VSRPCARQTWALWLATAGATALTMVVGLRGASDIAPLQPQGLKASPSASERVRVRFQVFATQENGPTTGPHVESFATLGVGETLTRHVSTAASGDPDLCQVGFVRDPSVGRSLLVWDLDARILAASPTQTTVELAWRRSRATSDGAWEVEVNDGGTVTLRPGEAHVFDYVRAPAGAPSGCRNLLFRVVVEPVLRDAQIPLVADLWLVYEGRGGTRSLRQQVRGLSGQPLVFRFDPLRWSPAGRAVTTTSDADTIGLEVSGSLVARLGADGFLDVALRAARRLSWGQAATGGEGSEDFHSAPGEAVAILLPPAKGEASQPARVGKEPFADGISSRDGKMVVDFARFFANSQVSLYVVIRGQE